MPPSYKTSSQRLLEGGSGITSSERLFQDNLDAEAFKRKQQLESTPIEFVKNDDGSDYEPTDQHYEPSTVYDNVKKQTVKVDADDALSGILKGTYNPEKNAFYTVLDPQTGASRVVSGENLYTAFDKGYKLETSDLAQARRSTSLQRQIKESTERELGGIGGQLATFGMGLADQLALGVPETILKATGQYDPNDVSEDGFGNNIGLEDLKKVNPKANIAGNVAGFGASMLYGGAITQGAEKATAKLLGAELAEAATKSGAKGLASRIAQNATQGAVEGAIVAAPMTITEAMLGDPEEAAENMLFSMGAGAGLPLAGQALRGVGNFAKKLTGKALVKGFIDSDISRQAGSGIKQAIDPLTNPGSGKTWSVGDQYEDVDKAGNAVLKKIESPSDIVDAMRATKNVNSLDAVDKQQKRWVVKDSFDASDSPEAEELIKKFNPNVDADLSMAGKFDQGAEGLGEWALDNNINRYKNESYDDYLKRISLRDEGYQAVKDQFVKAFDGKAVNEGLQTSLPTVSKIKQEAIDVYNKLLDQGKNKEAAQFKQVVTEYIDAVPNKIKIEELPDVSKTKVDSRGKVTPGTKLGVSKPRSNELDSLADELDKLTNKPLDKVAGDPKDFGLELHRDAGTGPKPLTAEERKADFLRRKEMKAKGLDPDAYDPRVKTEPVPKDKNLFGVNEAEPNWTNPSDQERTLLGMNGFPKAPKPMTGVQYDDAGKFKGLLETPEPVTMADFSSALRQASKKFPKDASRQDVVTAARDAVRMVGNDSPALLEEVMARLDDVLKRETTVPPSGIRSTIPVAKIVDEAISIQDAMKMSRDLSMLEDVTPAVKKSIDNFLSALNNSVNKSMKSVDKSMSDGYNVMDWSQKNLGILRDLSQLSKKKVESTKDNLLSDILRGRGKGGAALLGGLAGGPAGVAMGLIGSHIRNYMQDNAHRFASTSGKLAEQALKGRKLYGGIPGTVADHDLADVAMKTWGGKLGTALADVGTNIVQNMFAAPTPGHFFKKSAMGKAVSIGALNEANRQWSEYNAQQSATKQWAGGANSSSDPAKKLDAIANNLDDAIEQYDSYGRDMNELIAHGAPNVAASFTKKQSDNLKWIRSQIPTSKEAEFGNTELPTKEEMDSAMRKFLIWADPTSFEKLVKHGMLHPDHVVAMQALYPSVFEKAKQGIGILGQPGIKGVKIPSGHKTNLENTLINTPKVPTSNVQEELYATDDAQQGPKKQGGQMKSGTKLSKGPSMATETERLINR